MSVDQAYNYRQYSENLSTAGVLSAEQLGKLAAEGYRAVINLNPDSSQYAVPGERDIVEAQGVIYHYLPVDFSNPTADDFEQFERLLSQLSDSRVMVHCAANYRVSAFLSIYGRRNLNWDDEQAQNWISSVWNPAEHPPWDSFIKSFQ